ncbi:MAG TPA: histidine phosphatase family protein [Usitatibacter sp.]|nr:histidine phosphatase family protein [Usitatibacter sp.]
MTRIVVVRHGQTDWNVAMKIQGHGDSNLTEEGIAQAEAIAARLADEPCDVLMSSDLGRAHETAKRVAARNGKSIVLDSRLRERAFGVGEGMSYADLDRAYPGSFQRDGRVDVDLCVPGGESRRQFHARVCGTFEDIAATHAGRNLIVVAHGGVLSSLYRNIKGISLESVHPIPIANASYNLLRHDGRTWSIEAWSDTAHLDGAESFEEA